MTNTVPPRPKMTMDLGEFKPEKRTTSPEEARQAKEVAVASGFTTEHHRAAEIVDEKAKQSPKQSAALDPVGAATTEQVVRRGRKPTTNRNTQFAVKLTVETNNQIYAFADELNCRAIADVIEMALKALREKVDAGINPRE